MLISGICFCVLNSSIIHYVQLAMTLLSSLLSFIFDHYIIHYHFAGMNRADLSFNIPFAFWFRPAWASSEIWLPCISTRRALQHKDHFLGMLAIHCSPLAVEAIRVLGFLRFICKLIIKPRSVSDWVPLSLWAVSCLHYPVV